MRRTVTGLTAENVFAFGILALVIVTLLARCKAPLPDEPPIQVIEASDAAALLDVGPTPSACALACANFARQLPACREALGNCVGVCERTRSLGLITDLTIGCVAAARDRDAMHACGAFCP